MNSRMAAITRLRISNTRRDSGFTIRSRYRWRYRISTSVSPCHFSGSGSRHLARKCSREAQIVNSLVLVRNSRPSTPTQSPKSSSLKILKSNSGSESCRMYTWTFARPSESTRKFAFPNERMARMRPLVTVSTRSASSSSCVRWPYRSTSSTIVWRRSKRRGYTSTPSRARSVRLARRCSICSAWEDIRMELLLQLLPNRIQHSVDELHRVLSTERPRELERLVDDDRPRRARIAHQLADPHPEDQSIEDRHALRAPPLGGLGNQRIDDLEPRHGLARQRRRELAHGIGRPRGAGPLVIEEHRRGAVDVDVADVPLIENLQGRFAGAMPGILRCPRHVMPQG